MSAKTLSPAKLFAKQICEYLKKQPEMYVDDPQDVQDALGLTDADFKLGLDWCVERKLISLAAPEKAAAAPASAPVEKASPFVVSDEDETVGDRESVFTEEAAEVAAV
jgi:hypothetical protein